MYKTEKKNQYEPPAIIRLGKLAQGIGDDCATGVTNVVAFCSTGEVHAVYCQPGSTPDIKGCNEGSGGSPY